MRHETAPQAIPPQLDFVLCSLRPKSAKTENQIRRLLEDGLEWSRVLDCAREQNVGPLLYERLSALDPGLLTGSQRESLADLARTTSTMNLSLVGEMVRVYELLDGAQIPAIPYKGPVLSWLAYGSFALRSFSDIDFVVPQKYIPSTVSVLRLAGYAAQFDLCEVHAGEPQHAPGQYAFESPSNRILIEIHSERTLRYFPRPLDLEELNSRLIHVEIGGRKLRTFSVEDMLVMLSVHGAKHFWNRLSWIDDIASLSSAQPVNWPLAIGIASEWGCLRLLLLGLSLAHELLGAPLPPFVVERANKDSSVQWLSRRVIAQFTHSADRNSGVLNRMLFRLRSRDGIGQAICHTLRLTLSPTESDRAMLRLPRFLFPLYVLMRPWRLLREYGLGLKRK